MIQPSSSGTSDLVINLRFDDWFLLLYHNFNIAILVFLLIIGWFFCFLFSTFHLSVITLQEKRCQLSHTIKSRCEQWHSILQSMCIPLSLSLSYIYSSYKITQVCNIMLLLKKHLSLLFFRNCFASASADNIKKFNLPRGEFLHNMLWVFCLLFSLCLFVDNLLLLVKILISCHFR